MKAVCISDSHHKHYYLDLPEGDLFNWKSKLIQSSYRHQSGCWIWTKSKRANRYGNIWFKNKNWAAHRLSYLLFKGGFDLNLCVCHTCDVPLCINPDHLFLGTQADNVRDCATKGRIKVGKPFAKGNTLGKGENNCKAKLTLKDVHEIKKELQNYKRGDYIKLSKKYKVSETTISYIRKGKIWRFV